MNPLEFNIQGEDYESIWSTIPFVSTRSALRRPPGGRRRDSGGVRRRNGRANRGASGTGCPGGRANRDPGTRRPGCHDLEWRD